MAEEGVLYLPRADVVAAAAAIDPAWIVEQALLLHAAKHTTLPDEAYLGWTTSDGSAARSLALPGAVWGDRPAVGLKVINSGLGNLSRGIQRAQGFTLLFDPETAHPYALMEAAYLSTLRTAAYTVVSVARLANQPVRRVGLIGCGAVGRAHVDLLYRLAPTSVFSLFDVDPARLDAVVSELAAPCTAAASVETAAAEADVVVTATTTTTGYVPFEWLAPGALVAHVSLDDMLPDVVARSDLVFVDDWDLVRNDHHRLLGRMYRVGTLLGPEDGPTGPVADGPRAVDGTLADVLAGKHPGRTDPAEVILSNPFGMGILDVAVAAEVVRTAQAQGLGTRLPL